MKKNVFSPLHLILLMSLINKSFAQQADIILTNGKIFTSETNNLYVQERKLCLL